jgi:hypothetical protein
MNNIFRLLFLSVERLFLLIRLNLGYTIDSFLFEPINSDHFSYQREGWIHE